MACFGPRLDFGASVASFNISHLLSLVVVASEASRTLKTHFTCAFFRTLHPEKANFRDYRLTQDFGRNIGTKYTENAVPRYMAASSTLSSFCAVVAWRIIYSEE